jgi:hypothetical protein
MVKNLSEKPGVKVRATLRKPNKQLKVSLCKWSFLLTMFKINGGPELQLGHIVVSSDVTFLRSTGA